MRPLSMAENKWVTRVNPFVTISSKPTNPVPVDYVTTGKARLLRKVKASLSSAFTWRHTKIKGFEGKVESEQYAYTCVYCIFPMDPTTLSDDDWGVQSPPKRKVFKFHYHSQKVPRDYIWYTSPKTNTAGVTLKWWALGKVGLLLEIWPFFGYLCQISGVYYP